MGYFDENIDGGGPFIARASPAMRRQIGDFFIAWSGLESELDVAFHILFRLDPNLASCIYANLGTQAKIDILSSATDLLWKTLGKTRVEATHKILERIRILNTGARNTLAHGYHWPMYDEKKKKPYRAIVRTTARKRLNVVVHPGSVRYWRRATKAVEMASRALRKRLVDTHEQLKHFTDDQLWESTGFAVTAAEPILLRRHKPRPPKKAGSQPRPPSRGKS